MPLRGHVLLTVFAVCAIGCQRWPHPASKPDGLLQLELRPAARHAVRLGVDARYCAAESLVTFVGTDADWSAALVLRTPWPPTTRALVLDTQATAPGAAALGLRPLGDSAGPALVSLRGSVHLDSGSAVAGTIDGTLRRATGDTLRVSGRFEASAPPPGGCPQR